MFLKPTSMKSLINLAIIILLTFTHVKGQEYFSFFSGNPHWNVYLEDMICGTSIDTLLLSYYVDGDTTIKNVFYQKLMVERRDKSNFIRTTAGGIREEDRRVYFIGDDFLGQSINEELLLYDFSKKVGDTVIHKKTNGYLEFYSEILEIDSIKIGDNYRKRFKVDNHQFFNNPDYWVEGIGSVNNGLLGHITAKSTCGLRFWELICFRENEKEVYLNPNYSECYPATLVSAEDLTNKRVKVQIYSNPVTGRLHIDNVSGNCNWRIKIVNSLGQSVLERKLHSGNNQIKFPDGNGLFIIGLLDSDGQVLKSQKIIKQ